jgi:hypothetical protein
MLAVWFLACAEPDPVEPASDPIPTFPDRPDEDGDGFDVSIDCDDLDGAVNPMASEVMGNAIDDDCDNATDCNDSELNASWDGDVTEHDLPGFCDNLCRMDIAGHIVLRETALTDLHDLSCVVSVRSVDVSYNPGLTSLEGLEAVASAGPSALGGPGLFIWGNDNLTSLAQFDALESAQFNIGANAQLTSLDGLEHLTEGAVTVEWNAALTSVRGLAGLRSASRLYIASNEALTSLHGLQELRTIELDLWIDRNASLVDLDALYGVETVGGEIRIVDNPALTDEAAQALVDQIDTVEGPVTISGN